jgi:hypothetical protein
VHFSIKVQREYGDTSGVEMKPGQIEALELWKEEDMHGEPNQGVLIGTQFGTLGGTKPHLVLFLCTHFHQPTT